MSSNDNDNYVYQEKYKNKYVINLSKDYREKYLYIDCQRLPLSRKSHFRFLVQRILQFSLKKLKDSFHFLFCSASYEIF